MCALQKQRNWLQVEYPLAFSTKAILFCGRDMLYFFVPYIANNITYINQFKDMENNPGNITRLPVPSQWAKGFVAENVGFINELFGITNSEYEVLAESTQVVKGYNHFLALLGISDKNHYEITVYQPINQGIPEITGKRLFGSQTGGVFLQKQVSPWAKDYVAANVNQISSGFGVINDGYAVLQEATQVVNGVNHYLTLKGNTDKLLYNIAVYAPFGAGQPQLTLVSRQSSA